MMNTFKPLLLAAIIFPFINTTAAETVHMKNELTITGKQYLLIELAVLEFKKRALNIEKYRIGLYKLNDEQIVIFEDPNISPRQLGSSDEMPSFEVVFDREGRLSRAYFSR
jgi:hypothetical protein